MSIPGIKEIDFEQAYLNKPIPRGESHEKYIAKDFVLELGGVKIKLKASDSLRDVVRKINLQSHITGVRGKAVKGRLALESTTKGRGQPSGITLPKKDSGEGVPVNANQIIANYLASLLPKITDEEAGKLEDVAWADLINLCYLNSVNEEAVVILNEVNDEEENNGIEGGVNHLIDPEEFDNNNVVILNEVEEPEEVPHQDDNLNYFVNLNTLAPNHCDSFLSNLSQHDIGVLDTIIKIKLLSFNNSNIPKPSNNSSLPDRLYFCLTQIKKGKMSKFGND